ncbi:MAG TPA: SIS domain-containing protein [Candidatus Omnitrophota bacterium]|nr:SIS domain-containing protein [Candidatus Omnitrophota bacterium]
MENKINSYYETLRALTEKMSAKDSQGRYLSLQQGLERSVRLICVCRKNGRKMIFIGNGASASIASHMATDFWKNGKVRAMALNDAALLTCISNDFGYEHVFEKPIEMFANRGDIIVAISSSGQSKNILKAVQMGIMKGCRVITLSGFKKSNPLCSLGDVNFYVPFSSFGIVEVLHHSICHCLLDTVVTTLTH